MSSSHVPQRIALDRPLHLGVLASLALLSISYLAVMFDATNVVGGSTRLGLVVGGAVVLALVTATWLSERDAMALAAGALLLGLGVYLIVSPGADSVVGSVIRGMRDVLAMITGVTILGIINVDLWVTVLAPGPLFLSWYLALRQRFVAGAGVGLLLLFLFVLTGDAGPGLALVGVVGAAGVAGFGDLVHRDRTIGDADLVVIVLAAMLVLSLSVSAVPGGFAAPIEVGSGGGGSDSSEATALGTDGHLEITGNPTLDPTVRFTIQSPEEANWRVQAFDRYTGDGWVQTGETSQFATTDRHYPATTFSTMNVWVEADGTIAMPAQWRPAHVDGPATVRQSPSDGIYTTDTLESGDTYVVTSERSTVPEQILVRIESDYPAEIEDRYSQLPSSTPDRVEALTSTIVEDAESPYEAAMMIERFIIETNDYSLEVDQPQGDIADTQLFERDEGYSGIFATTMVVMLRTQDIPARMVTGYAPGERVAEDRWVVRDMDAHGYVEVYIPQVGWVEFDPTPSDPAQDARQERLEEAREAGMENVDTDESGGEEWSPEDEQADDTGDDSLNESALTEMDGEANPVEDDIGDGVVDDEFYDFGEGAIRPDRGMAIASREVRHGDRIALGLAILLGGIVGVSRARVPRRVTYLVGVYWQGHQRDPRDATRRAWARLETHLENRYEPRRPSESVRAYVRRLDVQYEIDARVREVATAYERARYCEAPTDDDSARRTVELVDDIVGLPVRPFGRIRK